MIKKGLCFVISLSMMMSTIPALAGEVRMSDNENNLINYIINDQFDEGTDGWIAGEVDTTYTTPAKLSNEASYTDKNGVTANGVLKIVFDETEDYQYWRGRQQSAYREFEPYTYKDGADIVIKTRVLQTGDKTGATIPRFDLKHNRPNTIKGIPDAENYQYHYQLFGVQQHWSYSNFLYPMGVSGDTVQQKELLRTSNSTNLNNCWIDVEMVIDGKANSMTIKTTANGKTETAVADLTQTDSVYRLYGGGRTSFEELASFTIQQTRGANTVYMDYIEVYQKKIEAELKVDATYKSGEPIRIIIDTKVGADEFKNALKLYDSDGNQIETVNTIDSTKKIVTMTPKNTLTEGETYILKAEESMLFEYELKETEKYIKISSHILDDTFDFGTDGWIAGEVDTTYTTPAKLSNVASYTDKNGVTANGVLKIEFDETEDYQYWRGRQQTAYRDLGTAYTYKDSADVVIKTRVLQTGDDTGATIPRFDFKHNRPNTTTGIDDEENYKYHYQLFGVQQQWSYSNLFYPTGVNGNAVGQEQLFRTSNPTNLNNCWIDVEMVIDGKANSMTIKTTANGKTETAVANLTQPDSVYRLYGGERTSFEELASFTIQQTRGANTVYVDYVEVYELKRPVIKNMKIKGNVFPNEVIEAEYDYEYDFEEGESAYEWFVSESESGPWTKLEGENGKTLEIRDDISEKYVRVEVTPVAVNGMQGKMCKSDVKTFEQAPKVSRLRMNSEEVYIGIPITVIYDYSDINNDTEGNTLIEWQTADSIGEQWTKIGEGKSIILSEENEGKFLRVTVTPVSVSDFYTQGKTVTSAICGPVTNILDATNEFKNPGAEEITDKWEESVTLEANNRYIISCMVKKAYEDSEDITDFGTYIFDSADNEIIKDTDYNSESAEEWTKAVTVVDVDENDEYKIGFMSFAENSGEAIIDNMYCGTLMICDIETVEPETIEIPEEGSIKVPVVTGKIFNQVGTTDGLEEEDIIITAEKDGVSVDGKNIVVDSTAVTGKLSIELSCKPTYPTTVQDEYSKTLTIELTAPENNAPRVSNVAIEGEIKAGNTLYGRYDFYQVEGKDDASEFMWLFSEEEDGDYDIIPGATDNKFTVTDEYKDKFIKFVVVPKTSDGLKGEEKISDEIIPYLPPAAKNIKVSGDFNIGGEIKGSYEYSDINGDAEGVSIFKWYISDSEHGSYSEITGANDNKLVVTEDMAGKFIKLGVTPVSSIYPETGKETLSVAYKGPVAPYITELSIKRENDILFADYKYHHEHNARESGTIFEWTVNGSVVSNKASYVIDFTGTKTVTLKVIPGGDTNPKYGSPVLVSANIKGKTKTSGGGGGGSSSGGSGGIAIINKTDVTQNANMEFQLNDLSEHWGADAIKNMVVRGVMTADENGKYNPDRIVTREEMVTYLFKALKLEKSEYKDRFEDVFDGEFANILQTMVNNGTIAKDVKFRPNDGISRQEYCKILYVSLENAGKLKEVDAGLLSGFADYSEISDWAKEYVNSIYGNKIMIGVSENTFMPMGHITKAQVATVLERMLSIIESE